MKSLLIFLFAITGSFSYSQEWELKKDKDNIKVYVRKLDSTKINEYKAVMVVKTSPEKALNILTDGDNLWKWNYNTSNSKLIKKISDKEFIFWIKNDLPWPIHNRDHVSRVSIRQNKKSTHISIEPDFTVAVPKTKDCIRITNFKGYWSITQRDKDTVEIVQQMYGDPNGSIPSWLLNSSLASCPYHSFLNLKELLEN